ncbi:MAG: hypothetical protein IT370_18775 [Deltaproteobacteria bacterium]|nr:hypothetical protein [Deltaproteobacteria bacterium]
MKRRLARALGLAWLAWVAGCGASAADADADADAAAAARRDAGGATDGATASADAAASADPDAALVADLCTLRTLPGHDGCDDACAVHLFLPTGGAYCTQQCDSDAYCTAVSPGLTCAPYGACVPRCSGDRECQAHGFLRCDTSAAACDTIPP